MNNLKNDYMFLLNDNNDLIAYADNIESIKRGAIVRASYLTTKGGLLVNAKFYKISKAKKYYKILNRENVLYAGYLNSNNFFINQ